MSAGRKEEGVEGVEGWGMTVVLGGRLMGLKAWWGAGSEVSSSRSLLASSSGSSQMISGPPRRSSLSRLFVTGSPSGVYTSFSQNKRGLNEWFE